MSSRSDAAQAALVAMLEKPRGWTEKQHLEAAQHHRGECSDFREKTRKLHQKAQRAKDPEEERKLHVKAIEAEKLGDLHHEISAKHMLWSRNAYRDDQTDYDRFFKGKV